MAATPTTTTPQYTTAQIAALLNIGQDPNAPAWAAQGSSSQPLTDLQGLQQTMINQIQQNPGMLNWINAPGGMGNLGALGQSYLAFQQPAATSTATGTAQGTAGTPPGSYASLTGGAGAAGAGGTAAGGGTTQTGATMANGNAPQIGQGYYGGLAMPGGNMLSAADSQKVLGLYNAYKAGDMTSGKTLATWMAGAGFNQGSLDAAVTNLQQGTGPNQAPQPESVALQQMGQIDPKTEALRQGLAGSYLAPLSQAAAPTAGQFQSLLNVYGQVDPTSAAARTKLGSDLAAQEALGTQLDPATQRQLEQQTRLAQTARGNVYGTPQLVQEAMTTGQAGLALQQQRQQALQGYLTSGASTGDLAMNLYNQQQANLRASQQSALGYLGSGQTPYQAGASYLNTAEQRAAAAAQGGAAYNQQGPSAYYTGQGTSSFPQYGIDTAQTSANYLNLMNAYNQPQGSSSQNKAGSAAAGALGGAATGAMTGMAAGPYGALIGAGVGAIGGAAKGYFS